jgi:hypothetical protein
MHTARIKRDGNTMTEKEKTTDPVPWRHVDGDRVADPRASTSPMGGYTFDPRPEYADHANRYISTRSAK